MRSSLTEEVKTEDKKTFGPCVERFILSRYKTLLKNHKCIHVCNVNRLKVKQWL